MRFNNVKHHHLHHQQTMHNSPVCLLQYLQFDVGSKVSLADLSYALEQEMRTVEEDNATYQAALASVECELKYQR